MMCPATAEVSAHLSASISQLTLRFMRSADEEDRESDPDLQDPGEDDADDPDENE
jgi:hypothetical protein